MFKQQMIFSGVIQARILDTALKPDTAFSAEEKECVSKLHLLILKKIDNYLPSSLYSNQMARRKVVAPRAAHTKVKAKESAGLSTTAIPMDEDSAVADLLDFDFDDDLNLDAPTSGKTKANVKQNDRAVTRSKAKSNKPDTLPTTSSSTTKASTSGSAANNKPSKTGIDKVL